jgi:cation:H+ antiporter
VSVFSSLTLVLGGLALLAWGGDILVRNAARLGKTIGLTPAVIGLTIVAGGTSLPEMVVSVAAAIEDQPDIAIANVVGSNIVNITFTLGLTALIGALPVRTALIRLEWPVLLAGTGAAVVFMRDASIDRFEGLFFLFAFILFTAYSVRLARREVSAQEKAAFETEIEQLAPPRIKRRMGPLIAFIVLGLAMLVVGGDLLVRGAVALARVIGMDERTIGLTIVAIGTGAPEIATSVTAALRKETAIAVANMIGSNIFNLLAILGVTALMRPFSFSPAVASTDNWWMLGTTVLLLPIMLYGRRITQWEGAVLVGVYALYLMFLLR